MREFADLEALVRATRPAPDPDWTARLDSRVARFEDPLPWYLWPAALIRGNLVPLGAMASVIVVVTAAALLAQSGSHDNSANIGSSGSSEKAAGPRQDSNSDSSSAGSAKSVAPDQTMSPS